MFKAKAEAQAKQMQAMGEDFADGKTFPSFDSNICRPFSFG